jgi:ABC-type branched-subunit amino acid transport system ATPase component
VWRGGFGRQLRAVRDNEDAARAFTVSATVVKLQGFAVAGFLAGLGGAVYGHFLASLGSTAFQIDGSINAAAVVVIGGMGVLIGPLLGTLYIIGVPSFVPLDNAGLAATAGGWLFLVVQYPGGIVQALGQQRERLLDRLARRGGLDPRAERDTASSGRQTTFNAAIALPSRNDEKPPTGVVLEASGVAKRFGGVQAVAGVDLTVRQGETVGLIGPNGAGKTTLFEILSGFTKPDTGTVTFLGADVTDLNPEQRGRRGLIRSFQDASLFPTLTVLDTVMLSLERVDPTRFGASVLGLQRAERHKAARAHELVRMMGLYDYRARQVRELSTGTRRIAELACLVALEPTVLLLDEPTSGIAQRETEALGRALRNIKEQLGLSLVIIEHDIPLVMSLSDRVVAMETGSVIAVGPPELIATDARVVASYLGTDASALARSGSANGTSNGTRTRRRQPLRAQR